MRLNKLTKRIGRRIRSGPEMLAGAAALRFSACRAGEIGKISFSARISP
jgi:hypothetical protein